MTVEATVDSVLYDSIVVDNCQTINNLWVGCTREPIGWIYNLIIPNWGVVVCKEKNSSIHFFAARN